MLKARQRRDILDMKIPTESGAYIQVPNWVIAKQPEARDNEEFNVQLRVGHLTYLVNSIDLEFRTK